MCVFLVLVFSLGFFFRSFVENPLSSRHILDLLRKQLDDACRARRTTRGRRRLSSSEFLFCVLCVVRTPTAATDTFFVVWLCSFTHVLIFEREGKKRSGMGTRVMMMRRALSVGGNNNGRKDVVVDDDDNDDNDERVFDEKTTTRRSPRGDGSGVEEHHDALEGKGVSGEKSSSSPSKRNRGPKKIVRKTIERTKSVARKRITGDPNYRIRDFLKVPKTIKTVDKVAFFSGVFGLLTTEAVAVKYPEKFWVFYCVAMPILLLTRMVYYVQLKWQYFMIDFCYFSHAATMYFHLYDYGNVKLYRTIFTFSNGPILIAIPIWRNSLVFHSWDKVQSVFIHLWPAVLTWCGRWFGHGDDEKRLDVAELTLDAYKHYTKEFWIYPMTLYIVWQVAYLIKTEIMDAKKFRDDPELVTSLRWLSMDTKNRKNAWTLKQFRRIGFFGPDEHYSPDSIKTKFVFVFLQFIYTTVTFLVATACYVNFYVHTFIILICFSFCVWNGATYYIEIFSSRYQQYISVAEERERVSRMSNEDIDLARDDVGNGEHQNRPLDDLDRILKHPR